MKQKLLERLRKSHNLSQGDIATRLGVSRPTYVLIEKELKEPTLTQAKLLSDLYSVPVDAIRTGKVEEHIHKDDIVVTQLPTKQGVFAFGVWNQKKGEEIIFLQTPNLDTSKPVLLRVHSECITGDTFHSYRCDCGEQKDRSLSMISESGNGVFIYLRQEGRGIGLFEKIKAYILQDKGYDTHEANILLGHKPDYREYSWVKKVLDKLGVQHVRLITNNPSKVADISRLGIKVVERVPLVIESNHYNRRYFETKRQKFKHFFGKDESNYFYQFSYVTSPEEVASIGAFMSDMKKDPFLKICMGVYGDSHILKDTHELKNIEAIFKSADHYEGFVPILHFTFKFSTDPIKDIASIREKMPFVKYIQLNDLTSDHLNILKYANKFFLVDIPLSDKEMYLIDSEEFVDQILKHKAFVLLDNSHGSGTKDTKTNVIKNINKLLSKGINDIAIYGGFGPNSMSLYFDLKEHYKINFSIDAETKLKTKDSLDLAKVKQYLSELINHTYTINPKQQFVDATREIINTKTTVSGLSITTDPEVFDPTVFFSSNWFADRVSKLVKKEHTFIEVGCGTGIVSIKVAVENPGVSVYATDINPKAAPLTKLNAKANGVGDRIESYTGDVLDSIPESVKADSIFWAMPFGYLNPEEEIDGRDTQVFDPGYRAIEKFFADAHKYLVPNGRLLIGFSVDIGHFELLEELTKKYDFNLKLIDQTKGVEKDAVSMEIYEARLV